MIVDYDANACMELDKYKREQLRRSGTRVFVCLRVFVFCCVCVCVYVCVFFLLLLL